MTLPVLQGPRLRLRPAATIDEQRFREMIESPEAFPWWPRYDVELDSIDAETGATRHGEYIFAVELDGAVVGMVQFLEETEPDYRHASIDIVMDAACHGRGLGSETLRILIAYLFSDRGHHRVTIDPAAANEKAIRAYEAVGFQRVGTTRQSERGPDGTWHDGVLMDLLQGELRGT